VDTRASPKPGTRLGRGREGQANGCRYFGHKEKNTKKSNDTGREEEDRKTQKYVKKVKEKSIGNQWAVCLWIKKKETEKKNLFNYNARQQNSL